MQTYAITTNLWKYKYIAFVCVCVDHVNMIMVVHQL